MRSPRWSRRAAASATASRSSLTPAITADSGTKRAPASRRQQARQRRLAGARRPPQDQRRQLLRLERAPQQLARPEQVLLPDELGERRGRIRSASGCPRRSFAAARANKVHRRPVLRSAPRRGAQRFSGRPQSKRAAPEPLARKVEAGHAGVRVVWRCSRAPFISPRAGRRPAPPSSRRTGAAQPAAGAGADEVEAPPSKSRTAPAARRDAAARRRRADLPKPPEDPAQRREWLKSAARRGVRRQGARQGQALGAGRRRRQRQDRCYARAEKSLLNAASNVKIVTSAGGAVAAGPRVPLAHHAVGRRRRPADRRCPPAARRPAISTCAASGDPTLATEDLGGDGRRSRGAGPAQGARRRWWSTTACSKAARAARLRSEERLDRLACARVGGVAQRQRRRGDDRPRRRGRRARRTSSSIRPRLTSRSPGAWSPPSGGPQRPRRRHQGGAGPHPRQRRRVASGWAPIRARSTGASRSRRCSSATRSSS